MNRSLRSIVSRLLFSFLLFPLLANAQFPVAEWQYTKDLDDIDKVEEVLETSDGGYLLLIKKGESYGGGVLGMYEMIATRLNKDGAELWSTNLHSAHPATFPTIKPLELINGNFLVRSIGQEVSYINGTTGSVIKTITDTNYLTGFAQLATGQIGLFRDLTQGNNTIDLNLKIYDSNLNAIAQNKTYGGTGNDYPVDITTSPDGANFVMLASSNSGASGDKTDSNPGSWVIAVNSAGTKVWDQTVTETLTRILRYTSKQATSYIDHYPTSIVKNGKTMAGGFQNDVANFAFIGTKNGKTWIVTGGFHSFGGLYLGVESYFGTTPIRSLSTTADGRFVLSNSDSVMMLNGELRRIWKTATNKGMGVELLTSGAYLIFGDLDSRMTKTQALTLVPSESFRIRGSLAYYISNAPPMDTPAKYFNGYFTDLDMNGQLDFFGITEMEQVFNIGDNYSNNEVFLSEYLTNTNGSYSLTKASTDAFSQLNFQFPKNWTIADFDRDDAIEIFDNRMLNVNPTTGVYSIQTTNLPVVNTSKRSETRWADFDNNGMLDVALHGDGVYLQNPANTFTRVPSSTTFMGAVLETILVDINKDGFNDIIDKTNKAIYLNNGAAVFTKHSVDFTHTPKYAVELNGDGFIDFIGYNGSTWYTFINNGSMAFTYTALSIFNPIPAGDINNDGATDVVAAPSNLGTNPAYYVYLNSGSGTFSSTINHNYLVPSSLGLQPVIRAGNFDNDGDTDIALMDSHQIVFLKNGQITSNQSPGIPASPTSARTGNTVTLSWSAATDDTTPAASLNYNVYVKNGSASVVSGHSNITNGKRILIDEGNAGLTRQFKLNNLPVGTYKWSVQSIDKGFAASAFAAEQTFYVTNNPTNITLSNATIAENSTANIGTFTTTDPDAGETHTYSLVAGTGDTDNALFKIVGGVLSAQSATSLNFEVKSSYSIRIRATDNRLGTFEKNFTITVTNVQETATQINLSATSIAENQPIGTTIGTLTNNDSDAGDTFTYTLVAGSGDTDNGQFEIVGNTLKTKQSFNFEVKTSYSIRIQVKDQLNNTFATAFVINITDLPDLLAPVISIADPLTITQTGFRINWSTIEGAASYEVEASINNTFTPLASQFPLSVNALLANLPLSAGTSYFVRVRAVKGAEKSAYSNVIQQITVPPNPEILDPLQRLKTGFTAAWNASTGAASYEIEVSAGAEAFVALDGYPKVVTGLDFPVSGLSPNSPYKYRVRAKNAGGYSGYSNEKSVITLADDAAKLKIETLASTSILNVGSSPPTVAVTLSGGTGTLSVTIKYRGIAQQTFNTANATQSPTSATNFTFPITAQMLDDFGLEYYATATDALETVEQSTHSFIYHGFATAAESPAIPFAPGFDGSTSTYQMFSVPYELNDNDINKMFNVGLNGQDKTQWRLFRFQDETLKEYPDGLLEIKPGEGFWFNTILSPVNVRIGQASVVKVNESNNFKMVLKKGWNQVGNPYPFDLNWTSVIAGNDKVGTLNVFNNGAYTKTGTLKVWNGAFVHASEDLTLNIPLNSKSTQRIEQIGSDIDHYSWQLPITVRSGKLSQQSGIGMHPDANISKDRFDEITVPRFQNYVELNTRHEEFFAHSFSTDVVTTGNNFEWNFTVRSNLDEEKELNWDMQSVHNASSILFLIDMQDQTWVDMKTTDHYRFKGKDRDIRIIYNRKGELYPGVTLLGQAFPNPFTANVSVPVLTDDTDATISVEVFDMLGRNVKTISETFQKSGANTLHWDGRDSLGSELSNGIYLYRIQSPGGGSQVKRMIKN